MARTPALDARAQEAVRLIANADAGFTQVELGQIFHVSRDCIQRVLHSQPTKESNDRPKGYRSHDNAGYQPGQRGIDATLVESIGGVRSRGNANPNTITE